MIPSRWIPEKVHWRLFAIRLAADPTSYMRFVTNRRRPTGEEIPLSIRLFPEGPVTIRARTADMFTLLDLLPPTHLPPPELAPIRHVWDLGANIGLTMAHIAARHPDARIVGVEMDPENAALARRNTAAYGDRCRIVEHAVWPEEAEVGYVRGDVDEAAFRVDGDVNGHDGSATTITLNKLLEDQPPGEPVDFVKMDIEGAEQRVLRENVEWAERVRCVRVEVHQPYTVEECFDDLRRLGFEPSGEPSLWIEGRGKPVQGIRRA